MEKRVAKKVDGHMTKFKNDIKEWLDKEEDVLGMSARSEFLKFVFDYKQLSLGKEDFQRRKRMKNNVEAAGRCKACRATGEQCSRRRKGDSDFCGTHIKGIPHGKIEEQVDTTVKTKKRELWLQDIRGIQYFLDNGGNVYDYEDVLNRVKDPRIIAKYVENEGVYSIPMYGI